MNIFFLDFNTQTCAMMHVDKHVIKMILETAQLLCSAVHLKGDYEPCYKLTHKNHPCSIWTRESLENYEWLCELGMELCFEYNYRYGKIHKCQKYIINLMNNPPNILRKGFTEPPQCMPDNCKNKDVIKAYRCYYMTEKKKMLSWKGKISGRAKPDWVDFNIN